MGFSIINHPLLGTSICGNPQQSVPLQNQVTIDVTTSQDHLSLPAKHVLQMSVSVFWNRKWFWGPCNPFSHSGHQSVLGFRPLPKQKTICLKHRSGAPPALWISSSTLHETTSRTLAQGDQNQPQHLPAFGAMPGMFDSAMIQ